MIWTILILVIAAALYLFGGMLLNKGGNKKEWTPAVMYAKKAFNAVAVILLVIGVNRIGLGTEYYLTESNPMILQTMAQNMQKQGSAGVSSKEMRSFLKGNMAELVRYAPVLGNVDAKNTIFVFTDASCPYCRRVHLELKRVLDSRDDVRVVIKNFSIHGVLSDGVAKATIAAKLQSNDKAAALFDNLMEKQYWPDDLSNITQDKLANVINKNIMDAAKKAGLDTAQLEKDMNGEAVQRELSQVRDLAQRFQINGTPYLIIGDQAFPGAIPYEQIMQALK